MGFVNQAGSDARKIKLHGLVFTLGVLVSFWALSAVLLLLRAGGEQLGWGFQLKPHFQWVFNYASICLRYEHAGVFEWGNKMIGVGSGLQNKEGLGSSFFSGVLATIVATLVPDLSWGRLWVML